MTWKFNNPTTIHCGPGCLSELADCLTTVPKPVLVLMTSGGEQRDMVGRLKSALAGISHQICTEVESNPGLTACETLAKRLSETPTPPRSIIAIGGGSVIDTAKILAACLSAPTGWSLSGHLLENQPWHGQTPLPIVAIPTTAGTGAEVTPFATVWHKENFKKHSLAHPSLFPLAAFVDSSLLLGSPRRVLISCGLDALSQALESVWNKNATPLTTAIATESVHLALLALPLLSRDSLNAAAVENIAKASLLAGLCISQTRTALAHAISYPLTARFGVPHGLACGITLPAILRFNAEAPQAEPLHRLAKQVGQDSVYALAQHIDSLLQISGAKSDFRSHVTSIRQLEPWFAEMQLSTRSDNNLRHASQEDICEILYASLR